MYLYGNWSVGRKVSDIFIFELAHKYSPHENVQSELPSPSSFDVFAGRKEGRKEEEEGRKEGRKERRKEEKKKGRKERRKEEKKKGRKEGRMGNIRFCAILTLYTTTSVHIFTILFS